MSAPNLGKWTLAAAGAVALAWALRVSPPSSWPGGATVVIPWICLVALAEFLSVSIPRTGVRMVLTPAMEFAALLLLGPAPAALASALGRASAGLMRRRPIAEPLSSAGEGILVVSAAGFALGAASLGTGLNATLLAGAFVTAWVARAALSACSSLLSQGRTAWTTIHSRLPRELLHDLLVLPYGLVLAMVDASAAILVAVYGLLPSLFISLASRRQEPLPDGQLETVKVLMAAIDAFDPYTRGHSNRAARRTVRIARRLAVPDAELREIELGALLHDIGRTAIHLDILQSHRPLDLRERAVINTHPTVGFQIVQGLPGLERAAEIVQAHHEQPDGRGYPRGLRGDRIPVGARIIMVVAAFDAMTSDRPYRRGLAAQEAYAELRRHAGTQFFPDVVEALIELHQSGELDRDLDELASAETSTPDTPKLAATGS
jgi:putative nucleotidyltransferase with HDIG domain